MPCFIKESLFIKICAAFFKRVICLYDKSVLKKIVSAVNSCFKQSRTSQFFYRYVRRNPYFINSVFYRLIKAIGSLTDRLMGFIHNLFVPVVKGSFVVNEARIIEKFSIYEKLRLLAVFIAAVEFGFCFGSFINATLSQVSFVYIIVPVLICMLLIASKRIIRIFKYSFVYRFIKFLLD